MLTALHGFTETAAVWRQVFGPTARCELLPGHGHAPCPPGSDFAAVAGAIAARMPAGGDLLGYSMGGRVALRLALDHPTRVRRLILISTSPGIIDPKERALRRARDERLAQILEEDGIGPFVAWWEANPALRPAKPLARRIQEDLRCLRLNQDPHCLAANLRQLGTGMMEPQWDRLAQLTMPVLLIAGTADPAYCDKSAAMAARIPNAKVVIIPDSGHAVHREQSTALLAAVNEFLDHASVAQFPSGQP